MARFFRLHRQDFSYYSMSELAGDISEAGFGAYAIGTSVGDPMQLQRGVAELEATIDRPVALRRSIIAYDVVVSAPKAVSVLWGLSDPTKAAMISRAHLESVRSALDYLQQTDFCREFGGELHGGAMEGVMFLHALSRNADPHLHNHIVVANQSYFATHGYRTIDQARFVATIPMLEVVYRATLTDTLASRLGIELVGEQLGTLHIRGQNVALEGEFSTRRREVLAASEEFGSSHKARDLAVLRTRGSKGYVDLQMLRELWRVRADGVVMTELPKAHNVWYFRGRDLQRRHGIYVSPVANEFHSEVAYRLLGGRRESATTIISRFISQHEGSGYLQAASDGGSEGAFGILARRSRSDALEASSRLLGPASEVKTGGSLQPRSQILGRSRAEDHFLEASGQGVASKGGLDPRSILIVPSPPRLAMSQLASLRESRRMGEVRKLHDVRSPLYSQHALGLLGRIDLAQGGELLIFEAVEGVQNFAVSRCIEELNANRSNPTPSGTAELVVGSRGLGYELKRVIRAHCDSVVDAGKARGFALGEPIQALHRSGVANGTLRRGDEDGLVMVDSTGGVCELADVDLKYVRSMLTDVFEDPSGGQSKHPRSAILLRNSRREHLLIGVDTLAEVSPMLSPERVRRVLQQVSGSVGDISDRSRGGRVPLHIVRRSYREMVDVASSMLLHRASDNLFDESESLLRALRSSDGRELPLRNNNDLLGRDR